MGSRFKLHSLCNDILSSNISVLSATLVDWFSCFFPGVVECMAAGNIMLAHDSGGPKLDIVTPHNDNPTGFLASTEQQYSDKMQQIFNMSSAERQNIRENARDSVYRFSEMEFEVGFLDNTAEFFDSMYGQGDDGTS